MRQQAPFHCLNFDNWTKRTSVVSMEQYRADFRTFNLLQSMKRNTNCTISRIERNGWAFRVVVIKVQSKNLEILVAVLLSVIKEDIPTLLFVKDMINNGLNISTQLRYIRWVRTCYSLSMENYFLIHRGRPDDIDFAFLPRRTQGLFSVVLVINLWGTGKALMLCKRLFMWYEHDQISKENSGKLHNICAMLASTPRRSDVLSAQENTD